jgi:Raf kinase inhibitor-like YbhB/YbcL family protein
VRFGVVLATALVLVGCGGSAAVRMPEPVAPDTIAVTAPAFGEGQPIPRQYTCHGSAGSPALTWRGVPVGARSLALVVSDPDAPGGTFVHWLLYDLPPRDGRLEPGHPPAGAREAANSGGKNGWYPPCPPGGTHRYLFTVYALSDEVRGGSAQEILDDIGRRTLARGTLTGLVTSE